MLDALVELLPQDIALFNKRCTLVQPAASSHGKSSIHFADGSVYHADLVVGCDGIKSVVRSSVDKEAKTTYMNTIAYRGLIPMYKLDGLDLGELKLPRMYVGYDKVNREIPCWKVNLLKTVSISSVSP